MKRLLLTCLMLAVAGCHDSENPGGELLLTLDGPGATDGALVLLIAGGPVTEIHSSSFQVSSVSDASGTHLIVIGDLKPGVIARMTIPELARASSYVAIVEQMADRDTFVLLDPAGYHVTISPSRAP